MHRAVAEKLPKEGASALKATWQSTIKHSAGDWGSWCVPPSTCSSTVHHFFVLPAGQTYVRFVGSVRHAKRFQQAGVLQVFIVVLQVAPQLLLCIPVQTQECRLWSFLLAGCLILELPASFLQGLWLAVPFWGIRALFWRSGLRFLG